MLIFGQLKDVTGTGTCKLSDVKDTDTMIAKLTQLYPGLREKKYLLAVEKDIVHENTPLQHNYTVAMLPPYSGG